MYFGLYSPREVEITQSYILILKIILHARSMRCLELTPCNLLCYIMMNGCRALLQAKLKLYRGSLNIIEPGRDKAVVNIMNNDPRRRGMMTHCRPLLSHNY